MATQSWTASCQILKWFCHELELANGQSESPSLAEPKVKFQLTYEAFPARIYTNEVKAL